MLAAAAMFTASMGITGMADTSGAGENGSRLDGICLLYTSDAADE